MTRSNPLRRLCLLGAVVLAGTLAGTATASAPAQPLPLIPMPASLEPLRGQFPLDADTPLLAAGEAERTVAAQFSALLEKSRGIAPKVVAGSRRPGIRFRLDPAHGGGGESYLLEVAPGGASITAGDQAGLFYGAVTLLQLATLDESGPIRLPALRIEDAPRFPWRGFMLDSARHFWSVEQVKQVIDAMALHKLNTLHWHLTDDQGWRVEIRRHPRLVEAGSCRLPAGDGAIDPASGQPRPYCGHYTQEQVREVVAYAAQHHITVVPEFDVPGHATAAIAAYPELGSTDAPLRPTSEWGVFPNLFNTEEATLAFLEDVIAELLPLFPGRYFHIGGDEAVKDQWQASARVQARMRELGLADETAMQAHVVHRLAAFLEKHGKRAIGWDEILDGELPAGAAVMSWRGTEGGLKAARLGHDVVMAPVSALYLDYLQTGSPHEPPGRPATITLQQVYGFEPVPEGLEPERQHHILGVQANLWTEHTRSFERLQHHMFPRLAALAEVAWSPRQARDLGSFLQRLPVQLQRYRRWGIGYASTPFQVDVELQDESDAGVRVALSNPLGYEIRYSSDGSAPTAASPRYQAPLQLPLPARLQAAAFFAGKPLAPARAWHWDAASLLTRSDEQLDACRGRAALRLRLEDDGPAEGERAIFDTDIFYPCWQWTAARLDGVVAVKVRAGRIPYYFQLAHDEPHRRFEPARSAHGELDVHAGGCDGQRVASVPLPAAPDADGFVELEAPLAPALSGRQDLCLRFTGDTRPQMWVVDRVTLERR